MNFNKKLIHIIRASGRRLTRQRQLVLEILEESSVHLDAETLFQEAKRRDANISMATVYRSLALLKEVGIVEEHRLGEDHRHFETIQAVPHYHFTCLRCGEVIEFEAPEILSAVGALSEREGLQVTAISLHLSGYCTTCQEESQREKHQVDHG